MTSSGCPAITGKKFGRRCSNSSLDPVRIPTWYTRSAGTTSMTRAIAEA